jgi:hypothetical protein
VEHGALTTIRREVNHHCTSRFTRVLMPDKTQFIVHFDGLELPPNAQATIAQEIRAAALRELARLDLKADFGVRIPRKEWLGLWLDPIKRIPLPRPDIGP